MAGQFHRFLLVGAANTVATYGAYLALLRLFEYITAYSLAYALGIVLSYWLSSTFVFRTAPTLSRFLRYPLVYALQYVIGAIVLWACVEWLGVPRELALACVVAVTVPVTFLASRLALTGRLR